MAGSRGRGLMKSGDKEITLRIEVRGGSRPSVEIRKVKAKEVRWQFNGVVRRTFMIGKVRDDF